jgi:hypothetical protein
MSYSVQEEWTGGADANTESDGTTGNVAVERL